jgi:hypothetical protein
MILSGRVGKQPDELAAQLIVNTEAKTECKVWLLHKGQN